MSTILPGYVQTPFGGWVADDGSGPYTVGAEDASATNYIPLPSGFWVKGDGSGPYFYDAETNGATEVLGLFRSVS